MWTWWTHRNDWLSSNSGTWDEELSLETWESCEFMTYYSKVWFIKVEIDSKNKYSYRATGTSQITTAVKNPPANADDVRDVGSIP